MPYDHERKSLKNGRPYYGNSDVTTQDAGDQPGAIPMLDGEPTTDDLPRTNGDHAALLYVDVPAEKVKVAIPENGTVSHTVVLDASGTVTLDSEDVTGLL